MIPIIQKMIHKIIQMIHVFDLPCYEKVAKNGETDFLVSQRNQNDPQIRYSLDLSVLGHLLFHNFINFLA